MHKCLFIGRRFLFVQQHSRFYHSSVDVPGSFSTEEANKRLRWSVTPLSWLPYEDQLKKKMVIVKDNLRKPANRLNNTRKDSPSPAALLEHINRHDGILCPVEQFVPAPELCDYRNKARLCVGDGYNGQSKTLGIYIPVPKTTKQVTALFKLIGMKECHFTVAKYIEEFIRRSPYSQYTVTRQPGQKPTYSGYWEAVLIRSNRNNDIMLAPSLYRNDLTQEQIDAIKSELIDYCVHGKCSHNITSLYVQVRDHVSIRTVHQGYQHLYGERYLEERLLGSVFRISPSSFFQLNTPAAERLYETVRHVAQLNTHTVLLDVCCGTGTIGILFSKYVKQVIAIEEVAASVEDAKHNAAQNGAENITYYVGRAERLMNDILNKSDTISPGDDVVAVLNPGRAGHSQKVTRAIRRCERIRKVVYISCKANGHAKENFYELCMRTCDKMPNQPFMPIKAVPVDMFPHTRHTELVLLFQR